MTTNMREHAIAGVADPSLRGPALCRKFFGWRPPRTPTARRRKTSINCSSKQRANALHNGVRS